MLLLIAIFAILAIGLCAFALDRMIGRRVGWLALIAGGTWYGWPSTWLEPDAYKVFLVGVLTLATLVVYGLAHIFGRRTVASKPGQNS